MVHAGDVPACSRASHSCMRERGGATERTFVACLMDDGYARCVCSMHCAYTYDADVCTTRRCNSSFFIMQKVPFSIKYYYARIGGTSSDVAA